MPMPTRPACRPSATAATSPATSGASTRTGQLYLEGRKKLLIEIGGYKVDPIEVQDVLAAHPAVAEAIVVGVAGEVAGEELVKAVVVPNGGLRRGRADRLLPRAAGQLQGAAHGRIPRRDPHEPAGQDPQEVPGLKTLLIDNYDSFTYNLFQLLAEANGDEPIVVRNDDADWAELAQLEFDNVVISPGPGSPEHEGDFGVCAEAIREAKVPLLGVCLGHQGLSWVHGGKVAPRARGDARAASAPCCTRTRRCSPGIPREFQAVRYHSLCVEQPLPEELEAIAWTSDGVADGRRAPHAPAVGRAVPPRVDLHRLRPPAARQLPRPDARVRGERQRGAHQRGGDRGACARAEPRALVASRAKLVLKVKRLDTLYDTERAFVNLYGDSETAFWLDSSKVDERARFSFMGAADGPLVGDDPLRRQQRRAARSSAPTARRGARGVDLRLPQPRDAPRCATSPTTSRSTSTAASSATSATS